METVYEAGSRIERLLNAVSRFVKDARYYGPLLAESHLTWCLFGGMLRQILTLPLPADTGCQAWQGGESNPDDVGELTRKVSERMLRNGANDGILVVEAALPGTLGALALERMQKDANGCNWDILFRSPEGKMEIP
jgi:hypothetical protein